MSDQATDDVLALVGDLMASSAAHTKSIVDSLWSDAVAEAHWLRHGIAWVLSTIPEGGTTAEYERGLTRIANLALPTEDIRAYYREQASLYIAGQIDRIPPHPMYARREGPA